MINKKIHKYSEKKQNPFKFIPRILKVKFDVALLAMKYDKLEPFVSQNSSGLPTINYYDSEALSTFNTFIMLHYFKIKNFILPKNVMQPCLGGRLNYVDWVAELIADDSKQKQKVLIDIGCGYSCIYNLIGQKKYGWRGIAVDSNQDAILNAQSIIEANQLPIKVIKSEEKNIFIQCEEDDAYIFTMCNPPFYGEDEYRKDTLRSITKQENEIYGGEVQFIKDLFQQSLETHRISWFTTLVGRKMDFDELLDYFKQFKVHFVTGKLYQGNNVRWVIAWQIQQ